MGIPCSICVHPKADAINAAIAAGVPYRRLRAQYGFSLSSISRHNARHMSPAWEDVEVPEADPREPLPERLERLLSYAETMYATAAAAGQGPQALAVLKEMRALLVDIGRVTGEIDTRNVTNVVNVMADPRIQWALGVMYAELAAYPEIRERIASRLQVEAPE